jgi:hypothetical protein
MASAAVLLLAAFAGSATTLLAPSPARAQAVEISSSGELVVLVRRLITEKRYDEARRIAAAWKPDDPSYKYRVAYVEGMIQQDRGDYEAAIVTYRDILAERPGFTGVRYDLTQALYLAGHDDAAKHNAELLIAAGVDDVAGGGLRNIVGAIDDRRPIRFRAFASVLPSTNLNLGTHNRTVIIGGLPFVIGNASQRVSGVGALIGGEVLFRQTFRKDLAFVGSLAVAGRFYPKIDYEALTFSGTAGIEKEIDRGKIVVSAVAEQGVTLDRDLTSRLIGGRVEFSRFVGDRSRVYTSLTIGRISDSRDASGLHSGWRGDLTGFVDVFLKPNRFIRVIGGAAAEQTGIPFLSYAEGSGGLGFYTEAPWGLTIYAQGTMANRRFRGGMPFFGFRREDVRFEGQITLTKRDLNFMGVAPQLTYTVAHNRSNSPFDDYTAHGLDLKFVKEF